MTWTRYWENVEFVLPAASIGTEEETLQIELGDLPANSTMSVTIGIRQIWEIPGDRITGRYGDFLAFYHRFDDPRWRTGPNVIFAPYSDPENGRFFIQFDDQGVAEYAFYYGNSSKFTYLYDADGEIIDLVETVNATIPNDRRLVSTMTDTIHRELAIDPLGGLVSALGALSNFVTAFTGTATIAAVVCVSTCIHSHQSFWFRGFYG